MRADQVAGGLRVGGGTLFGAARRTFGRAGAAAGAWWQKWKEILSTRILNVTNKIDVVKFTKL